MHRHSDITQPKNPRHLYHHLRGQRDIFFDQTGKYPTRSQSGNNYFMVMAEIDSNAILVEPMKNRKDQEMIRAYDALVKRLLRAGIQPKKAHPRQRNIRKHEETHTR